MSSTQPNGEGIQAHESPAPSKRGGRSQNSRNWQPNELFELVFARLDYEKNGAHLKRMAPHVRYPADLVHWRWVQRLKESNTPQIRDVRPDILDKKFREIWKAYERIAGSGEDVDLNAIGKDIPMSSKKCAWELRNTLAELSRFVGKSLRLSASGSSGVDSHDVSLTGEAVFAAAASHDSSALNAVELSSSGHATSAADMAGNEPPAKRPFLQGATLSAVMDEIHQMREEHKADIAKLFQVIEQQHTEIMSLLTTRSQEHPPPTVE